MSWVISQLKNWKNRQQFDIMVIDSSPETPEIQDPRVLGRLAKQNATFRHLKMLKNRFVGEEQPSYQMIIKVLGNCSPARFCVQTKLLSSSVNDHLACQLTSQRQSHASRPLTLIYMHGCLRFQGVSLLSVWGNRLVNWGHLSGSAGHVCPSDVHLL